jgi:hypothetical protein
MLFTLAPETVEQLKRSTVQRLLGTAVWVQSTHSKKFSHVRAGLSRRSAVDTGGILGMSLAPDINARLDFFDRDVFYF